MEKDIKKILLNYENQNLIVKDIYQNQESTKDNQDQDSIFKKNHIESFILDIKMQNDDILIPALDQILIQQNKFNSMHSEENLQ